MAHAQKPNFFFRRNGRVHLNWRGRQFSRLLAAEVCVSAVVMVVMLDTPCSEVVWRVLATHTIRQFPLYFPSSASPCAITFQLDSTKTLKLVKSRPGCCEHCKELSGSTKREEFLDCLRNFGFSKRLQQVNLLCVPRRNALPTIKIRSCQSLGLFLLFLCTQKIDYRTLLNKNQGRN